MEIKANVMNCPTNLLNGFVEQLRWLLMIHRQILLNNTFVTSYILVLRSKRIPGPTSGGVKSLQLAIRPHSIIIYTEYFKITAAVDHSRLWTQFLWQTELWKVGQSLADMCDCRRRDVLTCMQIITAEHWDHMTAPGLFAEHDNSASSVDNTWNSLPPMRRLDIDWTLEYYVIPSSTLMPRWLWEPLINVKPLIWASCLHNVMAYRQTYTITIWQSAIDRERKWYDVRWINWW